jgi:hypothetical protein
MISANAPFHIANVTSGSLPNVNLTALSVFVHQHCEWTSA